MSTNLTQSIQVVRSAERARTDIDWLDSRHSFSFGQHYDPKNTHFGLLLVSNDDIVAPNTGFSTHPHRDMEIVTWVVSGELEHKDSQGNIGLIYPGLAQKMSAGTGILHSEMNATKDAAVRFVQMWVVPDTARIKPGYAQRDINSELSRGGLVPLASGKGHDAAIGIQQKGAVLWVGRLGPGERFAFPDAPFAHLYVVNGDVSLATGEALGAGDAARVTGAGGLSGVAGAAGSEVLLWEMSGQLAA